MCDNILHPQQWCGQLAGWVTGERQRALCDALPEVEHRPSTGELFSCTYDKARGCRKDTVDSNTLTAAKVCLA